MISILNAGGAPASALAKDISLFLEALEHCLHRHRCIEWYEQSEAADNQSR